MKTGDSYSTDIRYVDIERKIFRIKEKVSLTAEVSTLSRNYKKLSVEF